MFSKRKSLRLREYDYSRDSAYFVTICTHNRQRLFGEIGMPDLGAHPCVRPNNAHIMVEKWLHKLEEKFPEYFINSYVIMPDHIHFILIKCSNVGAHMGAPLPTVVQWYKTQTTNEYIRGVKSGVYPPFYKHIWQRSFFDHIIRDSHDMQIRLKYIYDNPLKWWAENAEL